MAIERTVRIPEIGTTNVVSLEVDPDNTEYIIIRVHQRKPFTVDLDDLTEALKAL